MSIRDKMLDIWDILDSNAAVVGAVVIVLPLLILSLYVTIRKAYPSYRKQKYLSKNGIEITGIVIRTHRVAIVEFSCDKIDVQYEIAGCPYIYKFNGDERFRVGDEISLFVDPDNPGNASLKDRRWDRGFLILCIIGDILLFGLFLYTFLVAPYE